MQIILPVSRDGTVDINFMNRFIAELEAERVAELEAYLTATGLKDYHLSVDEENALKGLKNIKWKTFNLKKLFGPSTRGKRLKSADRIQGDLPFVTAGEADEGVSAFIGNPVHKFSSNTVTIDMFGSAKYRNFEYGADDHIAVVHTESLGANAAVFVATAIHKSSHNGQFNYGNNFYAKDADNLDIMLPSNSDMPDYRTMAYIISAVKKLVIKDVVEYADRKIATTKTVINN